MVGRRVPGSAAASANTARGSAISPAVRVDSEVFFNVIKRPPRSTCASIDDRQLQKFRAKSILIFHSLNLSSIYSLW